MSVSKLQDDKLKAEEIPERGAWTNQFEFVLSCLNYAVGLGNVWRFPYLVYRNGGGAFLVPYVIMLFAMGLPIFFLELVIGQYSGLGPDKAFRRMAPLFQGLGYSTLIVISLITIYYQVIIGWTIFYIAASFTSDLPWGSCEHDFNTYRCFSGTENARCISMSNETTGDLIYHNRICYPVEQICLENNLKFENGSYCYNETLQEPVHIRFFLSRVLSSEEYYRDYALGINGATWESWGVLRWENVLCLLLSYIILYLCLMKGVQSSGKAAYFTAIFPYVVLIALLVRSVTLEGSYDGILYYVTPNWDALTDASVWGDAASQTFYALGIGCGSLITLASYSRFNNNCHRDAFFVSITNFLTSILAGFVVFAMLGFLAKELDVPIEDVVQSGPGLAFITYPEAVLHMPIAPLWSVLFFIMLFTLGIGCQFPGVEAVNSAIIDHWPTLRTKKHWVCACTITVFFLLGLPMSCSGGVYLFTLMDYNTASWAILIIGLAEIALVAWVYGYKRFLSNVAEMSMKFCLFTRGYWSITWAVLSPLSILGVLFFILYSYEPARYDGVHFPGWVDGLGWMIGVASVLPLPLFAVYHLVRGKYVGWELLQSSILWGPPTGSTSVGTSLQVPDNNKDNVNGNYQSSISNIIPNLSSSLEADLVKASSQESISKDNTYENLGFQSDSNIDKK